MAAIVSTAPLSPLGGKDIDWLSGYGALIAAGLALFGITIFMALAVLVPGITTFADLMKPIRGAGFPFRTGSKWPLSIPKARTQMTEQAAEKCGVQLPIGINSLNELGHRIRIDQMTLDRIAAELVKARFAKEIRTWEKAKSDRGKWLQGLIDEATQWVIIGSYLSVKTKSDRARSVGLICGILGGALLIVGYIGVQAPTAQEVTTYAVVPSDPTSEARRALGAGCDVFTAVPLGNNNPRGTVTLYVTGGKYCAVNTRVELPTTAIAAVEPSPTPTPTPTPT